MKKCAHFTHFEQKNTHSSGCKIVHLCTIAIVIILLWLLQHLVTVALAFIILLVFSLSFFLSLQLLSLSPNSHCSQSSENATPCINKEHHIKKFLRKSSKTRNQYYTGFVWLPRKTQRKQEIKKISQIQRKSTDIWLLIIFPCISTLFHHFLTNQTRNKEN